jgi:hypothetical protein
VRVIVGRAVKVGRAVALAVGTGVAVGVGANAEQAAGSRLNRLNKRRNVLGLFSIAQSANLRQSTPIFQSD